MSKRIDEYLLFIVMMYISIDLASMVFAYKVIEVAGVVAIASSLIFPLTYSIMDVIAEVYGYKIAKKVVFYAFICDLVFSLLTLFISYIPSITQQESLAYKQVLGSLLRAVVAQAIGVLTGALFNIYLISKWKLMCKGRYFWLRSIGSSMAGEAVMLIISVLVALIGVLSINQLIRLIIYTYIYKIIFAVVAAPMISLIAVFLKNTSYVDSQKNLIVKDGSILRSEDLFPSSPRV